MPPNRTLVPTACALAALLILPPGGASAGEPSRTESGARPIAPFGSSDVVGGRVLDANTGRPIGDARVEVPELGLAVDVAPDGTFEVRLGGVPSVTIAAAVPEPGGTDPSAAIRYVGISGGRILDLRVFDPRTAPASGIEWGAPLSTRPADAAAPGPIRWTDFVPGGPLALSFSGPLPETIRVGRRFASSCSGNPVQRVDTVPLEEYVEGVLLPEIGVFRSVEGGPDSAAAVFEAFAVAARSYALWFYFSNPDAEYHLDDTACNQRYEEGRNAWVAERVAATRGQMLVAAADRGVIDKFEYAASCGRHGTRPEYQDALVPDLTGRRACVGSWCGHDDCAAHEVNPAVPELGRCLVRGICQWGAVERAMNGDSYADILAHYQPNLAVVDFTGPPATRLVGFVRLDDVFAGEGVPDVDVALDTGETSRTDADGFFAFETVEPGLRTLSYSGAGIEPTAQEREVLEGITNWASIAVALQGGTGAEDTGPSDVGGSDAAADAGPDAPGDDSRSDSASDPDPGEVGDATRDLGPQDAGEAGSAVVDLLVLAESGRSVERGCGAARGGGGAPGPTAWFGLIVLGAPIRRASWWARAPSR